MRVDYVKPEVPASAKEECAKPVLMPERKTTEKEAAALHLKDRLALVACELKRKAAVEAAR